MNKKVIILLLLVSSLASYVVFSNVSQHYHNQKLDAMFQETKEKSDQAINSYNRTIDILQSGGPNGFGSPSYELRKNRK